MKRILFLDDDEARLKWATRTLSRDDHVQTAITADHAIGWLAWAEDKPFDVVYLDHDLNGEVYVDSSRKDCGMEVVRWIVANMPAIGEIVVHSMNTTAGNLMVRALVDAGYKARYQWFMGLVADLGDGTEEEE